MTVRVRLQNKTKADEKEKRVCNDRKDTVDVNERLGEVRNKETG